MFVRRIAWRLGRKLYCWARRDLVNDPETNGEYWILSKIIQKMPDRGILLDIGANKGDWSGRAVSLMREEGRVATIYAFEPCSTTRAMLTERLAPSEIVKIVPYAASSVEGEADFFSNGAGSGTNSLYSISGSLSEQVSLVTLDSFIDTNAIDSICMLKIDTEGHDLDVLLGARKFLNRGGIEVVQFEYNWRWILNRASLRLVFELIHDTPYRLGKLLPSSIEFYDEWHFELDKFFENNYVLVRKGSAIETLGRLVRFDYRNCVTGAK